MSSLGLSQEELKAVEQTRQRLAQLSASLNSLKNDVFVSNPLPNLDSLQASADILNHNIHAILEILAQNNDLFSRIAIHPSTNFPGRTQENVLLQLLRKKPEPDVEAAMEEGSKALGDMPFPGQPHLGSAVTTNQDKEKQDALENIWTATRQACHERIAEYVMNEESEWYTAEEREMGVENVRTGLQRSLDDDESDEDDDEMDVDEGDGAPARGHADPEIVIIDRPPPPPAPAITTQEVDGATPEVILRIAARGQFT